MKKCFCLAFLIIACDKVVSKKNLEPYVETREVSCNRFSYCYSCFPGFDGKASCGFKMSPFCSGKQNATVKVTPVILTHESGRVIQHENTEILETKEACR